MDQPESKSEVARTLHQIDLELEAAERLEHGFAITARHDFINARMQRQGEDLLRLIDEGRHEEALALMNSDDWGGEREQTIKHPRHIQKPKRSKKRGK